MFGDEAMVMATAVTENGGSGAPTLTKAGSIQHTSSVGGKRGVFATSDLSAGQLVVLEWPVLVWDDLDLSSATDVLIVVDRIVDSPEALEVSRSLHPRSLSDVDEEERLSALQAFDGEDLLPALLQRIPVEEIARIFLVLKHNGFGSGLYRDLCMINHSCEPNCIKFEPRTGSRGASEVWTTRPVAAGEELTICYCSPVESLSTTVREYLRDQHGFDCHCPRCESLLSFGGQSALDADMVEWESSIGDAQVELQVVKYETTDLAILDRTAARLEDIFHQLNLHKQDIFEPDFLRLEAFDRMVLCNILLKKLSLLEESSLKKKQDTAHICSIAKNLLHCNTELLRLKRKYLGNDHPDLLVTLIDLSNAVDLLCDLLPPVEVKSVLDTLLWDDVLGCPGVDLLKTAKTLREALKKEISRLKFTYSLAKRFVEAVKIPAKSGCSFWGSIK